MASPRFQLFAELGRGGMGVVYEAYDRVREMRVALKQITQLDAAGLYRFKREFRALRGLSHPNIVQLYELLQIDENWFITMEVIDGVDFIAHVRGDAATGLNTLSCGSDHMRATQTSALTDDTSIMSTPYPHVLAEPVAPDKLLPLSAVVDEQRLRSALAQLANSLAVLHHAGIVHRDLKPSNIMVTYAGRVVLMDFGVVAELTQRNSRFDHLVVGTPAFMAPEQFARSRPTPAADWYAFGASLYQALTGRVPFSGALHDIVAAKKALDPLPPSAFVTGVPPDLEDLCLRLLCRDPSGRPSVAELLEHFGRLPATAEHLARIGDRTLVVGREAQLEHLRTAYEAALHGDGLGVLVEGTAGIGKTALLERFECELTSERVDGTAPLWLSGSCHGNERIPYNAFDGMIDQLCLVLLDIDESTRASLSAGKGRLLTRLFPVLMRIPELQTDNAPDNGDLVDLRQRGFAALRALFGELARMRPLVICIDDVHWADSESVQLITTIAEPPMPSGLLLIVSAMSEAIETGALSTLAGNHTFQRVVLSPLSETAQRAFIEQIWLPDAGPMNPRRVTAMSREAAGHPLLLTEFARYLARAMRTQGPQTEEDMSALTLDILIRQRAERLDDNAHRLLKVVALAGQRIPLRVAARACGLTDRERERSSTTLAHGHFARLTWTSQLPWIAAEHSKIREAILGSLTELEIQLLYRRLAEALEETEEQLSALTAEYWRAAGEPNRSARHLLRAADSAAKQLAFDRSEQLYRTLIDILPHEGASPDALDALCQAHIGLAGTMRITDRGAEALVELNRASAIATAADAVEQRATIHYLRGNVFFHSGDLERCLEEHQRAQSLAEAAGSPVLRCNALSGLGDAQFIRGYFISARRHYDACIQLAWEHDLTAVLAANLPARGMMHYFTSQLGDALRDSSSGADLAAQTGHKRAELVARSGSLSFVLLEMERYEQALTELQRALVLGQQLGSRRFEPVVLAMMGKAALLTGNRDQGMTWLEQAMDACRETGFGFVGPLVLGILARFTDERETREQALAQGQEILAGGTISHSYMLFYRDAIEARLQTGGYDDVARYASALEAYSAREPTPWSQFVVARARALGAYARDGLTPAVHERLHGLHEHALQIGFAASARALGIALGESS